MSSIRRKVAVTFCLAAALLLPAGGLVVFFTMRHVLFTQFDATLTAKAEALITAAEIDDDELEIDLDVQEFAGFGSPYAGDFFEVRRLDGAVLARSPSLKGARLDLDAAPRQGNWWSGPIVLPEDRRGRAVIERFIPAKDRKRQFGELQLIVASETRALDRTVRTIGLVLLATSAAGLTVTLLLLQLGLRRGLQPLSSMASEVAALRLDREGLRIQTTQLPDELRTIAGKLNDLLARVEASLARERRFSSHAAHELRTPLAELKLMIELTGSWPDEVTPERTGEMLSIIGELEALLSKLSQLAKTEDGGLHVQKVPVDLRASIHAAIQRFEPVASERSISFTTEIASGAFETDPVLWQTTLANLIGNAAEHAPMGSTVQVEASPAYLNVTNAAPSLTPADVDSMFERFWRKDSAHIGTHHSGLGLSIVQNCARLLGGNCKASLSADGKLTMGIQWGEAI